MGGKPEGAITFETRDEASCDKVVLVCGCTRACVCVWGGCVHECLVTQLCPTLCDPWTVAHQAPLSLQFPRQEHWSVLPFPTYSTIIKGGMWVLGEEYRPIYRDNYTI